MWSLKITVVLLLFKDCCLLIFFVIMWIIYFNISHRIAGKQSCWNGSTWFASSDLESLCVLAGECVWHLSVTLSLINYDGTNLSKFNYWLLFKPIIWLLALRVLVLSSEVLKFMQLRTTSVVSSFLNSLTYL